MIVGAFTRPHPESQSSNGDAWAIDWHEGRCRVSLIDGLGHGPEAAAAARLACEALAARPELAPVDALARCHEALRGSRGAAASIALIDPSAGRLTYAGVGNVEARLWRGGREERPIAYRGVLGFVMPRLRSVELPLADGWLLLLHTDGVSSRAEPESLAALAARNVDALAREVVTRWGREHDDATALVIADG